MPAPGVAPSGARRLRGRRRSAGAGPVVDTESHLGVLRLPNPIIAASGTYGHGDEVARQGDPSALGAVTVKSLSPEPWAGNPPPRLCGAPAGMLNSVGLANPGVAAWGRDDLPGLLALGARVIVSIWGRSPEEFAAAATAVRAVLDRAVLDRAGLDRAVLDRAVLDRDRVSTAGRVVALEVNVSCPNLEDRGRIFAHHPDSTASAVGEVVDRIGSLPVFAKLSPNAADLVEVARAALASGAAGLTLVNTLLGLSIDAESRRLRLGAGGGGLSGPALKPVALRAVHDVATALPGTPIIGTGGVSNGVDAAEMLLAGASAVGVGTATFRDPRAPEWVAQELARWCARRRVARSRDLVGAACDNSR